MKPEMSDTKFGVSVDISTSYLSAARVDDELLLVGRVIKEGTFQYSPKLIYFVHFLRAGYKFQASVWPSSKATS